MADPGFAGSEPQEWLWTQPTTVAAGDRFLALGYGRGVELWDWPPDSVPSRSLRWPGPETTALWAQDSTLYWCASDSGLRTTSRAGSGWTLVTLVPLGAPASALSGSQQFVAIVTGTTELRWARRPVESNPMRGWSPPGSHPVAYVSIRDSTAAVAGADRVYLVRLRDAEAVLLDSLALGAFVQALEWAGDSLYMGFGFSGLKMAPTAGDRFLGPLFSWTSQGTYGRIVTTDRTAAGLDFFGRMELFERGRAFAPSTRLAFDGTLRTATARAHEIAVLTMEHGLSILNVFTPDAPFWSHRAVLPGFVRDLESTPLGVFAFADFSGVYRLSAGEPLVVGHPYNAVSLDIEGANLAATSLLGGVGVADLSSGQDVPYAVVPTSGLGRKSVISGDRLFVAGDGACDDGLAVYRLSPPAAPVELQRVQVCGGLTDLSAGPGVVVLAVRDSGLLLLDATSPGSPPLASTPPGETWDQLMWDGSDLWGRNRSSQLVRWYWDGVRLREQNRVHVAGVRAFDVWQSTLVTADSNRSLTAWNHLAGNPPVPLDSILTRYVVTNVVVRGDTVWAVDRDAVIRAELQYPSSVKEPAVLPRTVLLDPPYPNPFNSSLTLTLHLKRGAWSLTIIDVLGRTLVRREGVATTDGPRRLVWSPEELAPLASGVYLLSAENANLRESRKAVYLK